MILLIWVQLIIIIRLHLVYISLGFLNWKRLLKCFLLLNRYLWSIMLNLILVSCLLWIKSIFRKYLKMTWLFLNHLFMLMTLLLSFIILSFRLIFLTIKDQLLNRIYQNYDYKKSLLFYIFNDGKGKIF